MTGSGRRTLLTVLALIAFAANSILCRHALGPEKIDATTFTAIRFLSGAVVLTLLASKGRVRAWKPAFNWQSGIALYVYAVCFSFAYVSLTAGTGALILFATVQFTMIAGALLAGERVRSLAWAGLLSAVGGLVYLVLPGISRPDPFGALLMAGAGVGWGVYSLRGRRSDDPLANTATNFLLVAPATVVTALALMSSAFWSVEGVLVALLSGVVASGLGYVVWYSALRDLTSFTAASVQLAVPVIAGVGGILFLGEVFSMRLLISAITILGGILMVLVSQARARKVSPGAGNA